MGVSAERRAGKQQRRPDACGYHRLQIPFQRWRCGQIRVLTTTDGASRR